MLWPYILGRLFVTGLTLRRHPARRSRDSLRYFGGPSPPRMESDEFRYFFECPDCGAFHEETLDLNCRFRPNIYRVDTLPITRRQVTYLDGHVDTTGAAVETDADPWAEQLLSALVNLGYPKSTAQSLVHQRHRVPQETLEQALRTVIRGSVK